MRALLSYRSGSPPSRRPQPATDQQRQLNLFRDAGRMHHLGVGAAHTGKRVLALGDDHQITVIELSTGEILSTHLIQPEKSYWRNQNKQPGRWPSSPN